MLKDKRTHFPVSHETVSPQEYLRLQSEDSRNIKTAKFRPPTPGKPGFGVFEVEYRIPKLVPSR